MAVAAIMFLPLDGFAAFWGAIVLVGAYEWAKLAGLSSAAARIGFVLAVLAIGIAARLLVPYWAPGELPIWFYAPVVAWWLGWGVLFRRQPELILKVNYPASAKLLAGGFVLSSAWILMVWLRKDFGSQQLLYLVFLIWVADAAAYFVGKNWGFTKLAPAISPAKTTEGVYAALAAAAVFALAVAFPGHLEGTAVADFVFLSLITVAISICGDLFESLAKRTAGVKDSGAILPGHGGVLDRVDSLTAGVSVFYAGSLLFGIFLQFGEPSATPVVLVPASESDANEAPMDQEGADVHEDHR
jgi:phosphatidate cytidylyltransferase